MVDPALALLIAALFSAIGVLLFRPARGWAWQWARASRLTARVLREDALKHLFNCEYQDREATLESVAGALAVSRGRTAEILGQLQERSLVGMAGGSYILTDEGRRYALRVVRSHRLWERYFSDQTGLEPVLWHEEAERREHTTTPEEADALSARLGDPLFDPHGDPIPTAAGEIAPRLGQPMTELAAGDHGEIVHIEDEPEEVYAQLVAEGLVPGLQVRVLEVDPQRIRFATLTDEHVLAPVVAANLSVVSTSSESASVESWSGERLSSLAVGESGTVVAISPELRTPERRRMFDLGLIPGTQVTAEIRSPGGDPTGYRVRGAVIALRREQASKIQIDRREVEAS